MEIDKLNSEIESVIYRLKELETIYYRECYGIETQLASRKVVTQIFKELLLKKEKYENDNNDNNNDINNLFKKQKLCHNKFKSNLNF